MTPDGYDIIGDIHGCASELWSLLSLMGYEQTGEGPRRCWRHPTRMAVFLGDYINRGPQIAETLATVKAMVDNGAAHAILGNHEWTALCYHTPDKQGRPLRSHTPEHAEQLASTHAQIPEDSPEWAAWLAWFRKLPLWLSLEDGEGGTLHCAHAFWDDATVERLLSMANEKGKPLLKGPASSPVLTGRGLRASCRKGEAKRLVREVLTGPETETEGAAPRHDAAGGPEAEIPMSELKGADRSLTKHTIRNALRRWERVRVKHPTFCGHYWLKPSKMQPLSPLLACVDYSAARGGALVAYRYNAGDKKLKPSRYLFVESFQPKP